MQRIDKATIQAYGIPSGVLMERAGLGVVERIEERIDLNKALILAGPGNNGGDGIMIGRELHNRGYKVSIIVPSKMDKLSADCKKQYDIAIKFGLKPRFTSKVTPADFHGAFIVDALFGTGIRKPVKGSIATLIEAANDSGCPIVAVDIPSGISADTGQALGKAIMADITVTFGCPKRGHMLQPGAEHTGELFIHDIGFPRELFHDISCNLLDHTDAGLLIPERPEASHKGDHGHLLIIAGSRGRTGAAFMTAEAALRSGAGLVTLAAPEMLADIYQSRVTEAMTLPVASTSSGSFSYDAIDALLGFIYEYADAVVIGPGLGTEAETAVMVGDLLRECPVPVVLDADGLNALDANTAKVLGKSPCPVILTPHPGEFSRISGMSIEDTQADRPSAALAYAKKSGAIVTLKGAPTVIAGPEGELFINTTGGPALAKGGTGDTLTGLIGGFLAQGMSLLEAALLGTHTHGLAGDLAAEAFGEHSTLASDVAAHIGDALAFMGGADIFGGSQ